MLINRIFYILLNKKGKLIMHRINYDYFKIQLNKINLDRFDFNTTLIKGHINFMILLHLCHASIFKKKII